jgi:hypothetical protein
MEFERYILGTMGRPRRNICKLCFYPVEAGEDAARIAREFDELLVDCREAEDQKERCVCTMNDRRAAVAVLDGPRPRRTFAEYCARLRDRQARARYKEKRS